MNPIFQLLQADPSFHRLTQALSSGAQAVYLHGLNQEATGHFLLSLMEAIKGPVFLVTATEQRALELAEGLQSLSEGRACFFPKEELNYFRMDTVISSNKIRRMGVLERLADGERLLVITTLAALERPLTSPEKLRSDRMLLRVGECYALDDLAAQLTRLMYERVMTVEHRGEFAIRGDILDIFPPAATKAYRLEFFDEELDSIRSFAVEDQRSEEKVDQVRIGPAEELILEGADWARALDALEKDGQKQKKKGDLPLSSSLIETIDRMKEDRKEDHALHGSDLLLPYLSGEGLGALSDYLPKAGLWVFEDLDRLVESATERYRLDSEDVLERMARGELLRAHVDFLQGPQSILKNLSSQRRINLTAILKQSRDFHPDALIQIRSMSVESFKNRWDDFASLLRRRQNQGYRSLILGGSLCEGLSLQLSESGIRHQLLRLQDQKDQDAETLIEPGSILLIDQSLPVGFRYPDSKLAILTMYEIAGQKKRKKKPKKRKEANFLSYQDLEVGDFVVHELYGVGAFQGTETMSLAGHTRDFLKIAYRGSDTLFVPTDEMSMVSKYISKEGKAPTLNKLGTAEWKKAKARAKKAVDAIAEDLVKLYAKRSKLKGYAFSPDSPWQEKFEADFPYEETPSQLRSIEEIKQDMESDRPMDRLLCGDVGYGKTEVALRAAFKAIMDGKQVAFLCPTTILTQQHYQTMRTRFQNFPARIEFLSRFKSAADQKEVVDALAKGAVDLVVGTHRLLSKDIHFKDLGLLIVDEEQRFGVKDKEKIKSRWQDVDVLTLSATPIPRTLQLSLTGIRDMSLLEEPPDERYPTITYVMEYDPSVIRDAIERELDRDGQVYLIHNRVYDMHQVANHIHQLVPSAELAMANGQMSTRELEGVMEAFVSGRTDILLATAIVETGMDIPNVNTMIILGADRMGLSQLYQLKGRIGRADRRSYAYFTYQRSRVLSEEAEKRLKAIRDFTEFGSGYKIAMRDLELRGAGNILGESQSGHIESIGYDLYVKMLEEAVNRAKGSETQERLNEIGVDIKCSAFIPDSYIGNTTDKMMMYRQIASISGVENYNQLLEELIDRYGDPPISVVNLMDIVMMKKMASRIGFQQIKEVDGFVELRYAHFDLFSVEELKEIAESYHGPLSFDFQNRSAFKIAEGPQKMKDVSRLLDLIDQMKRRNRGGKHEQTGEETH